jgi:hypothetical protein
MTLRLHWVVRQTQMRNVVLSTGELVPMRLLAAGLRKPHAVDVPYVDKNRHEMRHVSVSFGYAPVRLPGIVKDASVIAMVACGIQALMLLRQANTAARYIARVPQFIENVLLKNYRLWRGIQDALISSA